MKGESFRVPVLMYHHVEPERPAGVLHPDSYLTTADFARQLDLLVRRRFHALTLAVAARRIAAGEPLPPRPVVLTFDDGCRCFAEHALPLLRQRGLGATLFAVSGELGGFNRWDAEPGGSPAGLPEAGVPDDRNREAGAAHGGLASERREDLLDALALREVAEQGIEVASHGATHADLSREDALLDAAALEREVTGSKAALEEALGRPVETFCYPYGRTSPRAVAAVRKAGYRAAVAIDGHAGAVPGHPWAVPRMIVRPEEGALELWLKARGLYPAWSRLPRLGILRALRRSRRGGGGTP